MDAAVMSSTLWRGRLAVLAAVLVVVLLGFHATLLDMVRIWSTSSTFNHGFLIAPIAFYIAWQRRAALLATAPGTSRLGLLFAFANSLLWVAGELAAIAFFQHAALVGMLIGASWAVLGPSAFRVLVFPFFYLYFAVPEGEFLVPYLQDWTALVLVEMLRLTNIPVFLEGRYLSIPSGNFVVAEACSGINYLIATLAVGTMFMYLNFRSLWRRAAFMLVVIAVPLIANGLRAYGIVMIAHLSDYRHAMGIDHFVYGWVFFGIVIFAVFAIGSLFSDLDDEPPPPRQALEYNEITDVGRLTLFVPLLLVVLFTPRVLLALNDATRPIAMPIAALPTVPGWQGPEPPAQRLDADFLGEDAYLAGTYRDANGRTVTLELVYFRTEDDEVELVSQTNSLFDVAQWKQLAYRHRAAPEGSITADVYELELRDAGHTEHLVWQWYDTAGQRSARRLPIKLAQARARLAGEHGGGASVSLRTPLAQPAAAEATLAAFSSAAALRLESLLARDAVEAP